MTRRALRVLLGCALLAPEMAGAQPEPAAETEGGDSTRVIGRKVKESPEKSAEAVEVVDTTEAQDQAADMGALLNRIKGVNFRRNGGLGSASRITLNGLSGVRVRFFVDGLPLQLSAFGNEPTAIPVNLIQRVEVYKGVVPIRFGVDALGGVVHFVTDDRATSGSTANLSYEFASFGTHRASLVAKAPVQGGVVIGLTGFADRTDNSFKVDVEVDDAGQLRDETVRRFHDGYSAYGVNLDASVRDKAWADRLVIRGFTGGTVRDIQHDNDMVIPYGDVQQTGRRWGGLIDYHSPGFFDDTLRLDLLVNYTHNRIDFTDTSYNRYDWFGDAVDSKRFPGEVSRGRAVVNERTPAGRFFVEWAPLDGQALQLSAAPSRTWRDRSARNGDGDRDDVDKKEQTLDTLVLGLAWASRWWNGRIQNDAFIKRYRTEVTAEQSVIDGGGEATEGHKQWGGGDALKVSVFDWLSLKASYEYATRLPAPNELFGNGGIIVSNFELLPEISHNYNLGVRVGGPLDVADLHLGTFDLEVGTFLRDTKDFIFLVLTPYSAAYENVAAAETSGVEGGASWAWKHWVSLSGNFTWLDARNRSHRGQFERFDGDRLPNLPYLYANGSASLALRDLFGARDQLRGFWRTRYVHEFFRFWEGEGLEETKQVIPAQLVHNLGLTYAFSDWPIVLTTEARNVTNETLFDSFGIQRPGRSFHLKVVAHVE